MLCPCTPRAVRHLSLRFVTVSLSLCISQSFHGSRSLPSLLFSSFSLLSSSLYLSFFFCYILPLSSSLSIPPSFPFPRFLLPFLPSLCYYSKFVSVIYFLHSPFSSFSPIQYAFPSLSDPLFSFPFFPSTCYYSVPQSLYLFISFRPFPYPSLHVLAFQYASPFLPSFFLPILSFSLLLLCSSKPVPLSPSFSTLILLSMSQPSNMPPLSVPSFSFAVHSFLPLSLLSLFS